jgi:hypothetical protein
MSAPKVAPPPPKRLSAPPAPVEAPDNLTQSTDVGSVVCQDMNFKVKAEFHRFFKGEATMRGLSMKELLEACVRCYLDTHGSKLDPERKII